MPNRPWDAIVLTGKVSCGSFHTLLIFFTVTLGEVIVSSRLRTSCRQRAGSRDASLSISCGVAFGLESLCDDSSNPRVAPSPDSSLAELDDRGTSFSTGRVSTGGASPLVQASLR